jgi:molecular chaperone GrpE
VTGPDEKGKFSTAIGEDVIAAALKSVEKAKARPSAPPPGAVAAATAPTPEAAPAEPPAPEAADPRAKELEDLKQSLDFSMAKGREMMGKLKDEHEKMLRAVADLENFKKRAQKEKEEVQKFGIEKLLKDFLPIYDNFDRALDAVRAGGDFESFKKGVEMTRKLFEDTLGKHAVRAFVSKGQPFDPNRHEAMSAAESAELPPNHVHTEILKGFMLNDRLVRPALVIVSKAPEKPAAPEPAPTAAPAEPPQGS